jgi:hypothetical protein
MDMNITILIGRLSEIPKLRSIGNTGQFRLDIKIVTRIEDPPHQRVEWIPVTWYDPPTFVINEVRHAQWKAGNRVWAAAYSRVRKSGLELVANEVMKAKED